MIPLTIEPGKHCVYISLGFSDTTTHTYNKYAYVMTSHGRCQISKLSALADLKHAELRFYYTRHALAIALHDICLEEGSQRVQLIKY